MLEASDAIELCGLLKRCGVRYWVVGGWGVDALLQRQTRPHKDLDLLVALDDLPLLWALFDERGFALRYVWEENRWVDGDPARWPTAFVVADGHGRELDIHIIDFDAGSTIIQCYTNPWPFPDAIAGHGQIAGVTVPCVTRETQLAMHTGYPLPTDHQRDLDLLRSD